MPRGLAVPGSFVGDAIRRETYATIESLQALEDSSISSLQTNSYDASWDRELDSINSMISRWEQELAEDCPQEESESADAEADHEAEASEEVSATEPEPTLGFSDAVPQPELTTLRKEP